jgi:hypothetical protein
MNTGKRSTAITEAIATPQSFSTTHQSIRPLKVTSQQEKYLYFNLGIYTLEDFDQVDELQAGNSYQLVISCDEKPSTIDPHLKQDGKPVAGAFSLILLYRYNGNITIPIMPAKEILPFEDAFEEFFYEFTVPADFPACNLSLTLRLTTPLRQAPMWVAEYTLPVRGLQNALPLEILTVSQINSRLPEKTAILLVEMATSQTVQGPLLHLRGWTETGQQLDDVEVMNVIVSIEKLRVYRQKQHKYNLSPAQILSRLRNFSRNNSLQFLSWLNKLFTDYQEPFNLIIVDLTDKEIPWELLEFEEGLYLGAYARVVRWLPTHRFLVRPTLSITPNCHEGPIISYLDEKLGSELIQDERSALQSLVGKPYSSLPELKMRLADSLEEVGLIYIGCHGTEGQGGQGLGNLQQYVPELSSIMLEGTYHCQSPRLTVFMNACEAARTINKSADDRSNFVDVFLAHCASGFIGPLAQVDIQTASIIGKRLLLAAAQPGGVQIAELLRILRKNEIMQLEELKKSNLAQEKDYYRVLDTFMYVYYGNPLAYLQLHPRKEPRQ